jgi:hypothetical protein
MELAGPFSPSIELMGAEATDFKKRQIRAVPGREWNSSMHTVPRHAISAIDSVPWDVRVSMDSYSTLIALALHCLVLHNGLRAVKSYQRFESMKENRSGWSAAIDEETECKDPRQRQRLQTH